MNRILRRALLAIASLMVVCAALLGWQVFDYWKLASLERQLTAGRSAIPAAALTSPEARLARAQVLIRRAGPGAHDAALDLYRAVEAEGSEPLRRIARYDTANLYLRQAQDEMVRGEPGRAIPLVELAKGIYRTLLKDDPGDWDLRYNLERAVRLLPEDDPEAGDVEQAAPENMENAPTTVRGTTMGCREAAPVMSLARIRLLLLAILLAATAYAAWYREPPPPSLAGVGVLMVFDITQSMQVEDVQVAGRAVSRLGLAKRAAMRAIESLPCGVSVGAGVFTAHRSVLLYSPVEICGNRAEIVQSIGLIDTNMAWSGNSEVAKGYYGSLALARALPNRPALVFLTDGHEAPPINPRHRPAFNGEAGEVRATLVGLGGVLPVPIPKRDPTGRPLGFWNAEEVMQIDSYSQPRTASSPDRLVSTERATENDLRATGTPGSEHLSSLRTDYLQLLAAETGAGYRTVTAEAQLPEVVTSLLSISLAAAPIPLRRLAMLTALAAAAAFYCLGFLPWRRFRPAKRVRSPTLPRAA